MYVDELICCVGFKCYNSYMINKKLIVIIGFLIVTLALLTVIGKMGASVNTSSNNPTEEKQDSQEEQMFKSTNNQSLQINEDFPASEDKVFCTENGCTLIRCEDGGIPQSTIPNNEQIPFICSSGSPLVKIPLN
jgi:hypothetical protein